MITQLAPSTEMSYYDPLQTQFMTGGSMQYMPQAQFMTSADYGTYRTMPGTNMQTIGQKAPTFWQAYIQANRGSIMGSPEYMIDTYNPGLNQQRHQVMAQRQLQDKLSGFGAGMADFVVSMGAGALGTMVGGPLVGLAASMLAPQMAGSYTDRIRQQRKLQDLSLSKIVGGPDMAASIGQGFSMSAASRLDSGIRNLAVDDFTFNQEDYQKITQLGIESGMLDYSNSADQYKRTIKKLRDNFVGMMNILDSDDLKGLSESMQRMQRMGQDLSGMTSMAGKEAMFARMVGIAHKDMVNSYGQAGAMAYTQAGMTGYQGSLESMSQAATLTMMQRTGAISAGELSRMGGLSGGAQRATAGKANMINMTKDTWLPALMNAEGDGLDQDKIDDLISNDISMSDLIKESASRLKNPTEMLKYFEKEDQLLQDFQDKAGTEGTGVVMMQLAERLGQMLASGASLKTQLFTGYKALGMGKEAAHINAEMYSNPEILRAKRDQYLLEAHEIKQGQLQELKHNARPWNKVGHAIREFTTNVTEDTFGNYAANRAAEKDREENEKAGIFTSSDRGLSSVFTVKPGFAIHQDDIAEVEGFYDRTNTESSGGEATGGLLSLNKINSEDYAGSSWVDKALEGRLARARKDQQVRKMFMDGPDLTEEERSSARKDMGFESGAEAGAFLKKELDSADITEAGLLKAVQKKTGLNTSEAQALLEKDDGKVKRFVLKKAAEQSGAWQLKQEVTADYVEEREDILQSEYDRLDELKEDVDDNLTKLVDSNWFGRDKSAVDAIKSSIEETGSVKKGIGIYAAMVLQKKVAGGGPKTDEARLELAKHLKSTGMSEDDITKVVDHGRTDILKKQAIDMGISDDVYQELEKGAQERYEGKRVDPEEFSKDIAAFKKKVNKATLSETIQKLKKFMSEGLEDGHSFVDYIKNPDLITDDFLSGIEDEKTRRVYEGVKSIQDQAKSSGGGQLSIGNVAVAIGMANPELFAGSAKETAMKGIELSGEAGKAAKSSLVSAEALGVALNNVDTNIKENTEMLKKVNETLKNETEGGLFGLFKGFD